jgi:hypothetical protein
MKNLLITISLGFLSAIYSHSSGQTISASVSSVEITPPIEMEFALGGYGDRMNKPAESIHDPIWAKALTLRDGNKKYVIITLDILGLPANVKTDLIQRVSKHGWSVENIMLLPSHSHGSLEMAALNSKNLLNSPQLGIFQPELLAFLLDKLEILLKAADQNYQPVKVGTASQLLEGFNRNRRKDPEVDRELIVTRIELLNGKPLAVLVNWTAHPTFIDGTDMQLSAEWPGYLQTELQNLIGEGVTAMYYNGAEGDQSPVRDGPDNAYIKIQIYGKKIAGFAYEIYKNIKPEKVKALQYSYNTIKLPEHAAHPAFMKTGGEEYGLDENSVKIVMDMLSPQEVSIGAVRLGELVIAGAPGEMTAVLGLNVKNSIKATGIKYAAIGGLANEWISYILSRNQYINGEGYEASVSFYGPDLGEIISAEMIKTASKLTKTKQ